MSKFRDKNIKVLPYYISGSGRFYHFKSTETKNSKKNEHGMNKIKKWFLTKLHHLAACTIHYFEATTLHGFKYLAEQDRPMFEKVFWIIALLSAYLVVSFVVYDQIEIFFRNPVLISIEPSLTSVSEIPFPAVTICPDSQILSSIYNLSDAINQPLNSTVKQDEAYNYAMLLCHLNDPTYRNKYLNYFKPEFVHKMITAVNGEDYCKKMVAQIIWAGEFLNNSCKFMQPIVTYFGACLTFNMLPRDQIFRIPNVTMAESWSDKYVGGKRNIWSPDTGFKGKRSPTDGNYEETITPWVAGEGTHLTVVSFYLTLLADSFDELCSSGGKGFFGMVHNPAEIPGSSHQLMYAEEDNILIVTVTPTAHFIDNRLGRWNAKERGCYFQNERYLQYFKIYTQRNCEIECEANITEKMCNCRAFYHPRTQDIKVCGPGLLDCMQARVGRERDKHSCDCLPSCSELHYATTFVKINRNWRKHVLYTPLSHKHHYTGIYLKYEGRYISGLRRGLMVGLTDFIANIGGILGLFLGFSFLSVLEIIYFITLRYYTNCRRRKQ